MTVKCPQCGKASERDGNRFWPFCGERCKLLDLGSWLEESYRVPMATPPDENEVAAGKDHDRETTETL